MPLCIFLPKMSAYRRDFYETKHMSFLIKNNESLENYNEIDQRNTNFHNNKIPKEGSQCICLSVILLDSV